LKGTPTVSLILAARARITAIREHSVTRSARKDPTDPQVTVVQTVSLGYFLHLDFGPESGPISFGVGPTVPPNVSVGDTVIVAITKESRLG
jgi:hypothetical protein